MNQDNVKRCLSALKVQGVKDWVVCAGARNAPIVKALEDAKYFYEERSAAFFALGRAKVLNAPVAVITTSGTAAAELLPAMIEAHYAGIPLVAVTADRPERFRGSGAPQSIEQENIFGSYAPTTSSFQIQLEGPTHINLCLEEPQSENLTIPQASDNNMSLVEKPLVIVSHIPASKRDSIKEILLKWNCPLYLESSSGLRHAEELQNLSLRGGSHFLKPKNFRKHFDSVVRVGAVPTIRLWRDLDLELTDVPVKNFSDLPFSGLARVKDKVTPLDSLNRFSFQYPVRDVYGPDAYVANRVQDLMAQYPQSEVSFVSRLSQEIPEGSRVFLGNSLPIREWDFVAANWTKAFEYDVQRGANGIDGLVSHFLGGLVPGKENWLILGDLSALYDLSGLWALREVAEAPIRICVINNGGGMIFRRIFKDQRFENQHELGFSSWAQMFGVGYLKVYQDYPRDLPESMILEIVPDAEQTELFWQGVENI